MRIPRSIGVLFTSLLIGCVSPYQHPESLDIYAWRSSNGGIDAAMTLRDDLFFARQVLNETVEMNYDRYFLAAELMLNNRTSETILITHENVFLILEPDCSNLRLIGADEAKKHLYEFPAYLFVSGPAPPPWERPIILGFGVVFSPILYWGHKNTEDLFDEYYFPFGDIPVPPENSGRRVRA